MAVHSPVNGADVPWRSGWRTPSTLERLRSCQDAWCPAAPWDREEAHAAIQGAPAGSFLIVRDSVTSQAGRLCVSAGGDHEAVVDYTITCRDTAFQLSESSISFPDLAQLVFFYSLSRDVLALRLLIPRWISGVSESAKDRVAQLDPKTWLHPPADLQADQMSNSQPSAAVCSIQLTSSSGALCIINPLYVHEHGDDWLTSRAAGGRCATQTAKYRVERRLSTTRAWAGAALQKQRAISLDQESSPAAGLRAASSAEYLPTSSSNVPEQVVLRRPSQGSSSVVGSDSAAPELLRQGSPVPQSPHRVSWIQDGVWLPPPKPSSSLQPPLTELDSLSISSIEEEQENQPPSPSHHPSAHRLADKVIHRLSAVGQALGGLVCPKKRLTNRVLELSERKGATFSEAVKEFVEMTKKRASDPEAVVGLTEFLQEVRSSLTSLRETLLDYPEIQALLDSVTDLNDSEIDFLVEVSLHKVALKPVSELLYACIRTSRTNDGSLQRLQHNLHVLKENGVGGLGGSAGVGVPDSVTLEQIQQKWTRMHEAYSPNKKVHILLKVCKIINHSMTVNSSSGTVFGADDFLPCFTWVLLRSELVTIQVDTDYMMELLDPTQLQGEGGYYLTTLYAALYHISSFQPRLVARQLTVEAQHSLNQWHRRRTLHCDQSRRSKNRTTIRRQARCDSALQGSDTQWSGNKEEEVKARVDSEEPQHPAESSTTDLQVFKEETG